MTTIYLPTMFGDVRLESDDNPKRTKLITGKLSPLEERAVRSILGKSGDYGKRLLGGTIENKEMLIDMDINTAHVIAAKALRSGKPRITAIKLEVTSEVVESEEGKVPEKGVAAAVTTEVPNRGCPIPVFVAREIKATNVLKVFLSPAQLADFSDVGAIVVIGGDSGDRYRVSHRNSEITERAGHLVFNLDRKRGICNEITSLPPSEEVLALMLALRFKERVWLSNDGVYYPPLDIQ